MTTTEETMRETPDDRPSIPSSMPQEGEYSATLECGQYRWQTEVAGLGERDVTRAAFAALAALVDDPETDPEALGEFVAIEIVETGQLWVYPTDVFLGNLALRPGDQSKARRALERLAPQASEGDLSIS